MGDPENWFRNPLSQFAMKQPEGHPYFQVKRHKEDNNFLQQICNEEVRWFDQYNFLEDDVENHVKEQVIRILDEFPNFVYIMKTFREMSVFAEDYGFYHSAIRATAVLVYLLYTKECLYKDSRRSRLCRELNKIWKDVVNLGKEARPVDEVCNLLMRHTIDHTRYSFVTEGELAQMISFYRSIVEDPSAFHDPYKIFYPGGKTDYMCDIEDALDSMNSFSTLKKVDDYTRLMIMFVRDIVGYEEKLIEKSLEMLDMDALNNLVEKLQLFSYEENLIPCSKDEFVHHFKYHLQDLFQYVKDRVKYKVVQVMFPLMYLYYPRFLVIHPRVYEIIEVAEIRRLALGSRFIRRNHLMWAFYECGYGLPPEITVIKKMNFANEDHPPYHIYASSIKLMDYLGETVLQLQHFVFAILYAGDQDISIDGNRVVEMLQQFNEFKNAVYLDSIKRAKRIDRQKYTRRLITSFEMANLGGD
ncbi:hypothetical protein vseg_011930 [Gypsophila vaccaria]